MYGCPEVKSQLAKLLATEDLVVEHRQVQTAQFNVHTRVLTLPLWEKASSFVYDMLVGHEVGHALFTPDENWLERFSIPPQFVNVVEDARIEKLMKRKYAGISKTFYRGYQELNQDDFFDIKDENIDKMNLADRLNLYFKIGNFVNIPINSGEEEVILKMVSECETFEDALKAAEKLYLYCKEQQNNPQKEQDIEMPQGNPGEGDTEMEMTEQPPAPDSDESSDDVQPINESATDGETKSEEEPDVQTADSLEENLRDLVNEHSRDNCYIDFTKVDIDAVIAKNSDVHELINNFFDTYSEHFTIDIFETADTEYVKFKRSAQKEVNYLVKEFECRKSADAYARATTSRTGVLDTTKLHTYRYNEDLFKKVTTLADGKNHGLVFVLDWSGSMGSVLQDTLKQLYNLIWFCKKVNIPFEVYAFTNEWERPVYDVETEKYLPRNIKSRYDITKPNQLHISEDFSMMNILSSKCPSREFEKQMINMWRIANHYSNIYHAHYAIPEQLSLSGTPLNEALLSLRHIIPQFQNENKLQKVQCIVLTDGEANQLNHTVEIRRGNGYEPYIGTRRLNADKSYIRDRKIGTTYKVPYCYHEFTDMMLRNLKDNFPNVNFVGIRVLAPRDANHFIKLYHSQNSEKYTKIHSEWRKQRSFCIKDAGYDAYFGLSSSVLSENAEFEVDEGATKSKIKSAFAKSLKTKKLNKKVLGEFISLVA
jgi:hypothetical protein